MGWESPWVRACSLSVTTTRGWTPGALPATVMTTRRARPPVPAWERVAWKRVRWAPARCEARRPGPRQAARAALIALVTGLGLRAMDGGRGVIDVKDDALGWAGVRGATGLHQHACQAGERGACDVVCAPRVRRL